MMFTVLKCNDTELFCICVLNETEMFCPLFFYNFEYHSRVFFFGFFFGAGISVNFYGYMRVYVLVIVKYSVYL